ANTVIPILQKRKFAIFFYMPTYIVQVSSFLHILFKYHHFIFVLTNFALRQVVGSVDPFGMKYSAAFRVQAQRAENIQRMGDLFYHLLMNYYKMSAQRKPQHIV